jgi:hypothetical protein
MYYEYIISGGGMIVKPFVIAPPLKGGQAGQKTVK